MELIRVDSDTENVGLLLTFNELLHVVSALGITTPEDRLRSFISENSLEVAAILKNKTGFTSKNYSILREQVIETLEEKGWWGTS